MSLKIAICMALAIPALAAPHKPGHGKGHGKAIKRVHLGPRPFWLIDQMEDSPLKTKLESCSEMEMKPSAWSISHRGGGTLQFPEETYDSIMAGTRMGAGIQECDVTFTKDLNLICRHAQCDLHTTTNVVSLPALNAKCTTPFKPANGTTPATAKCCTSDFTLAELSILCAKMDASNPNATTPAQFLLGTPAFRTDLYARSSCPKILSVRAYIALVDSLALSFTPELKTPDASVPMPFPTTHLNTTTLPPSLAATLAQSKNYTQALFAQHLIDEFKAAGIAPARVWPQSFLYADVLYWLEAEPSFGKQAVLLDESADSGPMADSIANLTRYAQDGVRIVAPPLPYLVSVGPNGAIVASAYAKRARELGLGIVTWSLERSGWLGDAERGGYYYESVKEVVRGEGDVYTLLHVLAQDVGVLGVFSDWSATVTYYANCFGLGV